MNYVIVCTLCIKTLEQYYFNFYIIIKLAHVLTNILLIKVISSVEFFDFIMSDVSCQTFDFDTGNGSEDTQDALRINPFQRGGGAEKKGTDNSTNQTENVTKKNSTLPEIRVAKRVCFTIG